MSADGLRDVVRLLIEDAKIAATWVFLLTVLAIGYVLGVGA